MKIFYYCLFATIFLFKCANAQWISNGNNINYTAGTVAVGTASPWPYYNFAVQGSYVLGSANGAGTYGGSLSGSDGGFYFSSNQYSDGLFQVNANGLMFFGDYVIDANGTEMTINDPSAQISAYATNGYSMLGGNFGIGVTDTRGYKLAVDGSIIATSMTVKLRANWPDYVFKKDYRLLPLSSIKRFVDKNHHLPGVPSEKEIAEKGLNLGDMNNLLMKKVEELTLYMIEKDKDEQKQIAINLQLNSRIEALEDLLNQRIPKHFRNRSSKASVMKRIKSTRVDQLLAANK